MYSRYGIEEPERSEAPEVEAAGCTCEVGVNSMNDACATCQAEFEEWCEELEASGLLGPAIEDEKRKVAA